MLALVTLFIAAGLAGVAYTITRNYVARRLRYVDVVRSPLAPFAAAAGATMLALPVVGILPLVGMGTALLVGAAVGFGTRAGVRGPLPET